jgi:hypothetical protein
MIKEVPANFTLDELLAYLRQEVEEPDDYCTFREWKAKFGVGERKLHELMREAKEAGILHMRHVTRERLDGHRVRVPAYAFDLRERDTAGTEGEAAASPE